MYYMQLTCLLFLCFEDRVGGGGGWGGSELKMTFQYLVRFLTNSFEILSPSFFGE